MEVEWSDACTKDGWDTLDSYKRHAVMPCKSIGYLVSKNTDSVIIVQTQTHSDDNGVTSAIAIPKAWIKRIKKV